MASWQARARLLLDDELAGVAGADDLVNNILDGLRPIVSEHVLGHTLPLSRQLVSVRAELGREQSIMSALVDEAVDGLGS